MKAARAALWGLGAVAVLAVVARPSVARASGGSLPSTTPSLGASGAARVRAIAQELETELGLPGFADFATATAYTESRYKPEARHTRSRDLSASRRGWARTKDSLYAGNPYAAHFTVGGYGLFGMLPTTAMASEGLRMEDPRSLLDPYVSTVALADFVNRVRHRHFNYLPPEARTWLTIRRFMASNEVGLDFEENSERAQGVRERLTEALRKSGGSLRTMNQRVRFARPFPGTAELLG